MPLVLASLALWHASLTLSVAQSLTDMRAWTSSDGKTIQAELLTFSARQDPGTARFRVADGAVFTLPISRFANNDRAIILKELLNSTFRVEFSRRQDSCFFYSQHLTEDDWADRTWAYIGSDIERSWLRLAVYSEPGFFSSGDTLIMVGKGPPLQIEYKETDIDGGDGSRSRYEGIDTLITDQADDLFRILEDSASLELFVKERNGNLKPLPLSPEELAGLKATSRAFHEMAPISNDQTWWATLLNRSPDEFRSELSDPLLAWRAPGAETLTELRTWKIKNEEVIEAELLGFELDQAILRDQNGELISRKTTEFQFDDLTLLASTRLATSLEPSWHPVEDFHQFYWPKSQSSSEEVIQTSGLLFVTDRRDETPRLILQHLFEGNPETVPFSLDLVDEQSGLSLQIPLDDPIKLRTSQGVVIWESLSSGQIDQLLHLSGFVENLSLRSTSSSGESELRSLKAETVSHFFEALEIYRMHEELHFRSDPLTSSKIEAIEPSSNSTNEVSDPEPVSILENSEIAPPVNEIFSAIGVK